MNNIPCVKWPLIIAVASLVLLSCMATNGGADAAAGDNYRLHKTFNVKALQALVEKSNSTKLVLNIYPVKQTANVNKQDFDIMIVPCNEDGKPLEKYNKDLFEKRAANYASFLHQKNITADAAQLGYRSIIDAAQLKKGKRIFIFLNALKPIMNRMYISDTDGGEQVFSDSVPIGRCPPCFFDPEIGEILLSEYTSKPDEK